VDASVEREHAIESVVRDSAGDVVVKATARWLVGPREDFDAAADAKVARRSEAASRSDSARRASGA
jgi:hypothetical protein